MTKILKETVQYDGFNKLVEYDIQAQSLVHDKEWAAPINREVIYAQDAVTVLLYAPEIDSFIFCEQFRTGPFFHGDDDPFILEAPAGMIDKGLTPHETAIKEVEEETGLIITDVEKIAEVYPSSGRTTEKTYIYYAEIPGSPKDGIFGLAHEGEEIKTHIIPRGKIYDMLGNHTLRHAQTVLALNWFRVLKDRP